MTKNHLSAKVWAERIFLALLFLTFGSFIMLVFNPWGKGPMLNRIEDYLTKIGVSIFLLIVALLARKSERLAKFWPMLYAFFILTVAVSLDYIFAQYLIKYLGVTDLTPVGWALPKLNECFVIVSVIIIFNFLSGGSLGSIYIQKGNLKLGLIIGLVVFFLFAAGSISMASLFKAQGLSLARIIPWIPWILIFILANATMEELLFRGLFLRKLQPFFGKFLSNFLVAVVFAGIHLTGSLTGDERIFVAFLFPLALALGYIMQKTDGVWGSILFHAGMDIPVIIGLFSNL